MQYEIIPVANGFILRVFTVSGATVGTTTYKLGKSCQEELVFVTFNALVNELRSRLAPTTT